MDKYRGQAVLITGGLGFIGSNLAIRLVEAGARVTVVDSMDPTCGGNLFNIDPVRQEIDLQQGDIRDAALIRRLVRGQAFIFNLAGHVSHRQSMDDPFNDLQLNAVAPLSVLTACKDVNREARIVYAGTRQAYGRPQTLPLTEAHPIHPIDINGVNKFAGEWYHMVFYRAYGMPCTSLRMVNTFGPRQLVKHARQGFAGWFIRQAIDGGEIQIFGDGQQLRGFNYVDDVSDALLAAGVSDNVVGDVFNLSGQEPFTLETYTRTLIGIARSGSYRIVPFPPENKAIDIGSVYSDSAKFRAATGWTPKTSLPRGLEQTIDFYRQHREHYW